jgi:hypothetical protein
MNDEYTRENRIKRMNLKLKVLGLFLTCMSIMLALFVFTIGSIVYTDLQKVGISVIIGIVLIILFKQFKRVDSEVDDIFKS